MSWVDLRSIRVQQYISRHGPDGALFLGQLLESTEKQPLRTSNREMAYMKTLMSSGLLEKVSKEKLSEGAFLVKVRASPRLKGVDTDPYITFIYEDLGEVHLEDFIVASWNAATERATQLKKVGYLNSDRQNKIRESVQSYPSLPTWTEAIEKVTRTPFLLGKNDRNWVVSFDFFIEKKNLDRILEGAFDESSYEPAQKLLKHGEDPYLNS